MPVPCSPAGSRPTRSRPPGTRRKRVRAPRALQVLPPLDARRGRSQTRATLSPTSGQGRPTPSRKEGMTVDQAAARRVERAGESMIRVRDEVGRAVVGQRAMIDRLLIGLLTGGHVLLEGLPGLAKTLAVSSLARTLNLRFRRIQFTPDLLPADLTGTLIYNPKEGTFSAKKGPLFSNIVLADEINRAPAKVQSALLEAMQEKQITIGDESYALEEPFLVL